MVATRAMESVLRAISPDDIWFLGDAVGKGPQNDETCDWVRANCRHFIGGNWDYGVGNREFPADAFYWDQLGSARLAWLASLPPEDELWLSGIRFRLFHGRPVTPLLSVKSDDEDLCAAFHTQRGDFGGVIFADSHRPFFRTMNCGYIMNTGSVGNSMGIPRAHALLVEAEEGCAPGPILVTVISVPYDNDLAAELARHAVGLPRKEAFIREGLTGIYSR